MSTPPINEEMGGLMSAVLVAAVAATPLSLSRLLACDVKSPLSVVVVVALALEPSSGHCIISELCLAYNGS